MRYRMLGRVAAHDGVAWHEIGAAKPRALLAALMIRCGDVVTIDQLLFELWGDRPPRTALTQIHGYVLRIRRALGTGGAPELLTVDPGYRLTAGDDDIDALVFTTGAEEGRAALRAGATEHAAEVLGAALALWRGPALADVPASPLVVGFRRRLTELRHGAWEARVDADLALGRHRELVDELARHVDAHPLRETPWRQLMRALAGAGRRDEALAAYDRLRAILVEHSGIEPGATVRALHDELRRPVPHQVPEVSGLVGRAAELSGLDALADRTPGPVVATVAGPAGIGKTALVRHWASGANGRFPDGRLYADLHGYTSGPAAAPATVLAGFLHALGVPAEDIPADEDARGALYRSRLAGRRALVVLDNARDAGQVRPLLPGPSGCLVLVTSRDDLRGLTATHGAHLIRLPVLEPAAAVALLGRDGGRDGGKEIDELATLCGHLPLALRIAAGRLAEETPVADLVSALRAGDLAELAHRSTAVRASFDVSYAALPTVARFVFRLLGLVPGTDFTADAVAALAGLPTQAAVAVLDRLAAANMVEPNGPGRFACHDLLRRYARELAPANSSSARQALADHYLATAIAAAEHVSPNMARVPGPPVTAPPAPLPDLAAALAWLDAERANLVAAVGLVPGGWRLVDALRGYLSMRLPRAGWAVAAKVGLAAAVAEGSAVGQAAMHLSLGLLAWCEGRYTDSGNHFRTARTHARESHWPEGESTALNGCGRAEIGLGRMAGAVTTLTEALAIDRAAGFHAGEARELFNIGLALQGLGRLAEAIDHQRRALVLYEQLGDRRGRCVVADNLAWVRRLAGGPDSLTEHASALAMGTDMGWQHAQAGVLRTLAALHRDAHHYAAARRYADRAVALARVGGEHQVQVDALTVLGDALVGLGHHGAAERCYTEARDAAETSGFATGRVDALLGLANLHVRLPAPATARTLAERALSLARAHDLLVQEGRALTVLATATTALGRPEEAARHAELALATHRAAGHPAGAEAALTVLDGLRDG